MDVDCRFSCTIFLFFYNCNQAKRSTSNFSVRTKLCRNDSTFICLTMLRLWNKIEENKDTTSFALKMRDEIYFLFFCHVRKSSTRCTLKIHFTFAYCCKQMHFSCIICVVQFCCCYVPLLCAMLFVVCFHNSLPKCTSKMFCFNNRIKKDFSR